MTSIRIISGGQTGVDRAALDAALALDVPCGGWCPAGRRAEDGRIANRYPLKETASGDYAERTKANIRDSDATLLIGFGRFEATSPGTHLTAEVAEKWGRPVFVARLTAKNGGYACISEIRSWIGEHGISVLNIAGPRESEAPGVYAAAHDLVLNLLTALSRR